MLIPNQPSGFDLHTFEDKGVFLPRRFASSNSAKAPSPWQPTPCFKLVLAVPSVSEPKNDSGTEGSEPETSPYRIGEMAMVGGPYEVEIILGYVQNAEILA